MAGLAPGRAVALAVTIDASSHGGNIRCPHHNIHFSQRAMTGIAFNIRFEVRPVAPKNPIRHRINTHPRDVLLGLGKFRQLVNRRSVLGHRPVAGHALARGRKRHLFAGVAIHMTLLALEPKREVLFMAEGDGLRRRSDLRLFARLRVRSPNV